MEPEPESSPLKKASEQKPAELLRRREPKPVVPRFPVWRDHRAWLSSCILHTCLFVTIGFLWQPRSRGTGEVADRPLGIALVHQSNDQEEYFLTGAAAASTEDSKTEANARAASAAIEAVGPPISVSELISDLTGASNSESNSTTTQGVGEGLAGLGTSTDGPGSGKGKSTASFMGLRGSGSSFVYVLDRSASMLESEGAPMRVAKQELLTSVQSLTDRNQFQIVFYNESPGRLSPGTAGGKLLQANELNKEKAARFVQAIAPQGGTEHIPAVKMGLSFAPDVLFFLTDAAEPAMSESQLLEIQSRAERSLTTIHTIQFNRGPETNDGGWIRDLAEMNRGTYRYVDILTLQ